MKPSLKESDECFLRNCFPMRKPRDEKWRRIVKRNKLGSYRKNRKHQMTLENSVFVHDWKSGEL